MVPVGPRLKEPHGDIGDHAPRRCGTGLRRSREWPDLQQWAQTAEQHSALMVRLGT